jgi:hypothetical protein
MQEAKPHLRQTYTENGQAAPSPHEGLPQGHWNSLIIIVVGEVAAHRGFPQTYHTFKLQPRLPTDSKKQFLGT